MTAPTVLLFNPISTSPGKQRLPMSLLAIAAVIDDAYTPEFVDGNLIGDPATHILERARATGARLLAVTVMPGPQLRQAIAVCKQIKAALPELVIAWGGYFPTHHGAVCVQSSTVDCVIEGQGEPAFRRLVDAVYQGGSWAEVPGLVWCEGGELCTTPRAPMIALDDLPLYPYDRLDMTAYLGKSYLGQRVLSHNTKFLAAPLPVTFALWSKW
ncbi:hypothetical protein HC928_01675 [bacterium]|nr:hypothetical protein [bacterium]